MKKPAEILAEFENHLESIPDKKVRVRELVEFIIQYGDSYGSQMETFIDKGISLSREIGFDAGEIICYYNLAFFSGATSGTTLSKYQKTMPNLLDMKDKLKDDREWYPIALNLYAYSYWFKGEYEKAFSVIFENLKMLGGKQSHAQCWNYFALGVFYFDTKDFENSISNYQKAYDMFKVEGREYGMARASNGLGTIAIVQNRLEEALSYLEFSAGVYRKLAHYAGLSRAENDMGMLEKANKNYKKAIHHLNESIDLRKEIDHVQGLITSYTELGETYLMMKEHKKALEQFDKGMALAIDAKARQKQMRLHKLFYETFKELGNTALALENFEKFFEIKSQLMSDEAANSIKKIQTQFEKEKSEKEAEIERLKNFELKKASEIIEQKNKDILDSIRYAKRIQTALMTNETSFEKMLSRLMKKK